MAALRRSAVTSAEGGSGLTSRVLDEQSNIWRHLRGGSCGSKLITAVMMELAAAAAAVLRQRGGLAPSEKSAAGYHATDAGS